MLDMRKGRVAVLTLNRPDSLNALDTALMRRLAEAVRAVAEDDGVGCVVLTGAGRGFCAGGDMKAVSTASRDRVEGKAPSRSTTETRARWLRRNVEASRLLHEMPKPTIAMINGPCAGAGMSLAAACDLRLAGESATFRPAFTAIWERRARGNSIWSMRSAMRRKRWLSVLSNRFIPTTGLKMR
jgi:2-(1,2-epoxy-1,2-dihydrophenyl)acetyl-CoA isomerase